MKFPFVIHTGLDTRLMKNWNDRFGLERSIREVTWRRTQDESNKNLSLWGEDGTARRRLLYFQDKYAIQNNNFCLQSSLIHVNYKAPKDEIEQLIDELCVLSSKWEVLESADYETAIELSRGDLKFYIILYKDFHPFEEEITEGYWNLDIAITANCDWNYEIPSRAFYVLKMAGIRKKLSPGIPTLINKEELGKFFPAQVALGCGPSIEAGIPPLHYMHDVYGLKKPDGRFVLKPSDDRFLVPFLENPEAKYQEIAHIHKCCLLAEPTPFYHKLKEMHDRGDIVGPIITNNFDGLCISVGLEEMCMRKYDRLGKYPDTEFHPDARSLFVIGSHADRRRIEESARKKKLQIVYIDPCGYNVDGAFDSYPIESPQEGDFLLPVPAGALV